MTFLELQALHCGDVGGSVIISVLSARTPSDQAKKCQWQRKSSCCYGVVKPGRTILEKNEDSFKLKEEWTHHEEQAVYKDTTLKNVINRKVNDCTTMLESLSVLGLVSNFCRPACSVHFFAAEEQISFTEFEELIWETQNAV